MAIETKLTDVYGFMKPLVDVHTMGIFTMANLLRDCGYKVYIAPDDVNEAIENIHKVIDPLFLNDLRRELDEILEEKVERQRKAKLEAYQDKLARLTFLDPHVALRASER